MLRSKQEKVFGKKTAAGKRKIDGSRAPSFVRGCTLAIKKRQTIEGRLALVAVAEEQEGRATERAERRGVRPVPLLHSFTRFHAHTHSVV
jgi:hypothetical protein